jgi:hypothetical protein
MSHNRYGNYGRQRSIPVQPDTLIQMNARTRFGGLSSDWATLGATDRLAWKIWAQNNPMVDVLGDKRVLTAAAAYVGQNCRLDLVGEPTSDTPPIVPAPAALTACTIVVSKAANSAVVTFTPSPLGTDDALFARACKMAVPTINYVKNLMRYIGCSAKAQTTPMGFLNLDTYLGTLNIGETCVFWVHVMDRANGAISPPRQVRTLVVA